MKKKNKYIAIFIVKKKDSYTVLGKRRFKASKKTIRFKGRTYLVDVVNATYSRGLKSFYFIDIEGSQIVFKGNKVSNYDPDVLDMILSKSIVKQLTANIGDNSYALNIMTLVVGAVMGGLLGYIIAGVI